MFCLLFVPEKLILVLLTHIILNVLAHLLKDKNGRKRFYLIEKINKVVLFHFFSLSSYKKKMKGVVKIQQVMLIKISILLIE